MEALADEVRLEDGGVIVGMRKDVNFLACAAGGAVDPIVALRDA